MLTFLRWLFFHVKRGLSFINFWFFTVMLGNLVDARVTNPTHPSLKQPLQCPHY